MKFTDAVAKRTRTLLNKYGLSQYRVAKDMVIDPKTLSNVVNAKNKKSVSWETIFAICNACKITIFEFFNDEMFKSFNLDID